MRLIQWKGYFKRVV